MGLITTAMGAIGSWRSEGGSSRLLRRLLQSKFVDFEFVTIWRGVCEDVAIFDSGREPRGEPGGDGERDACRGGG